MDDGRLGSLPYMRQGAVVPTGLLLALAGFLLTKGEPLIALAVVAIIVIEALTLLMKKGPAGRSTDDPGLSGRPRPIDDRSENDG